MSLRPMLFSMFITFASAQTLKCSDVKLAYKSAKCCDDPENTKMLPRTTQKIHPYWPIDFS